MYIVSTAHCLTAHRKLRNCLHTSRLLRYLKANSTVYRINDALSSYHSKHMFPKKIKQKVPDKLLWQLSSLSQRLKPTQKSFSSACATSVHPFRRVKAHWYRHLSQQIPILPIKHFCNLHPWCFSAGTPSRLQAQSHMQCARNQYSLETYLRTGDMLQL